jgi:hypothetical protein
MGHHESQTKADRTRIKQAALRAAGSYAVGEIPYGYDVVTLPDGRKTLRPNDQAPVVTRIFKEVAADATFYEVARGLTADGIPTYRGNAIWSEGSIKHIIRRTIYRGHVQYRRVTYMEVEPLTTAADWLRANEGVKARARRAGHGSRGPKLTTLLRPTCGNCGAPMYRWGKSYRCAGVGPSGTGAQAKGCGNTIKMDALDDEIWKDFAEHDEPLIETTIVRGTDHAEEIAAVELALKDLSRRDPEYHAKRDVLDAEFDRLVALPVEADQVISVRNPEGKTEGDAFREMTPEGQRESIRLWTLTVWPKDSEHQSALVARLMGRRWTLDRKEEGLSREAVEILAEWKAQWGLSNPK